MSSTIEEQVRNVDKVVKECDQARKQLEQLTRRLDDLYDEVKRYKDFLGYEKGRRDPGAYSTEKKEKSSGTNGSSQMHNQVIVTMGQLTNQLVQEWDEKLKIIRSNLQALPATPSTSQTAIIENNI